jgi:hypothetical protein
MYRPYGRILAVFRNIVQDTPKNAPVKISLGVYAVQPLAYGPSFCTAVCTILATLYEGKPLTIRAAYRQALVAGGAWLPNLAASPICVSYNNLRPANTDAKSK